MLLGLSGQKKEMDVGYDAVNGTELGDGGVEHGALLTSPPSHADQGARTPASHWLTQLLSDCSTYASM